MIRKMVKADSEAVLDMMRVFYASEAVLSNGSEEIFKNDFETCIGESPYLEGYTFEDNSVICGYAMVAKSFSTEFGKPCLWIEDIYVKPEYRSRGMGGEFLDYIKQAYPDCVIRLEAEEENSNAIRVYEKHGFSVLPYLEMIIK